MVASQWTLSETPAIASGAERESYRRRRDAFSHPTPELDPEGWMRGQGHRLGSRLLHSKLAARIIAWEERDTEDDA
jgi:hypothetical protein